MINDVYNTIAAPARGAFRDRGSRFLSFAYPVSEAAQAMQHVAALRNEYHDARHVCFAYRIGDDGAAERANDDGEPSGTAGKPILGQITFAGVTDILIAVVRYFGGVLLGTSGLINAYRAAAKDALQQATVVEKYRTTEITVTFDAADTNKVMRLVKATGAQITAQTFDRQYKLTLCVRKSSAEQIRRFGLSYEL
jgi:uncharacterized YigZ family protein